MALNIFSELDLTATGDNVDEGFLKCKNNWSTMDTELNDARGGEVSLDTRIDAIDVLIAANLAELTAGRDGETDLITKINAMDATDLDINGVEFVIDADGDTTMTADTDDQIDWKIAGTDQFSFKDGVIEPTTDNDVDLGASAAEFKDIYIDGIAYIDEFDIDGTYQATFPTNGVSSDTKIMMGDSNTIAWFYLNTAPPGWKVSATGGDTVLAVSGGAGDYNVNGGNPDTSATWSHIHTMGTHVHQVYNYIGLTTTSQGYNSSGTATNLTQDTATAGIHGTAQNAAGGAGAFTQDLYTTAVDPGDTAAQTSWRPSASVGKLYQLDTA